MPWFRDERPLGTSCPHSCHAGLRTGRISPRLSDNRGLSCSCRTGLGDFCFLRDFGVCTAKAGSPGRTAGPSPECTTTAGCLCFCSSSAKTTASIAETAAKTTAARNTLSGEASTPGSTSETATSGGILGEASATGSTPTSETTVLLGIPGEATSPAPGKSAVSAGGAACKAAALRSVEAGESCGTGRISMGSGFFCCLSVWWPDIAGSPMRAGLYGCFPAGLICAEHAARSHRVAVRCPLPR